MGSVKSSVIEIEREEARRDGVRVRIARRLGQCPMPVEALEAEIGVGTFEIACLLSHPWFFIGRDNVVSLTGVGLDRVERWRAMERTAKAKK